MGNQGSTPEPPDEATDWATWGRSGDVLNTCTRGTDSSDDPYLWRVENGDANAEDNHIPEDQVKKGCPDSGDNRWGLCPVDGDGNAIDTEDDTIFHASKVNWHHGVNNPYLDQTGESGATFFSVFRGGDFPTTACAATRFALDYCANVDDNKHGGKYGPIWDGAKGDGPVPPEKRFGAYWDGNDLEGEQIANKSICRCYEAAKYANGLRVSAPLLQTLAVTLPECLEPLDHVGMANKFCQDPLNFNGMQIGRDGSDTCITRDLDGSVREKFCKLDGNIKSDGKCTKASLGEAKYEEVAKHYCDNNIGDSWCKCYNLTSGKCNEDGLAYGCAEAVQELERKKEAFGMDGYNILRANIHCRPRACTSGWIPKDKGKDCKSSYHFCDQDIDIRTATDSDIILKCQLGDDSLPEFMQNPNSTGLTRLERLAKRFPPFDTFPLNKTHITRWPVTWRWSDPNVKYIAGYSVSTLTSSLICFMLFTMSGRR